MQYKLNLYAVCVGTLFVCLMYLLCEDMLLKNRYLAVMLRYLVNVWVAILGKTLLWVVNFYTRLKNITSLG